MVMQELQQLRQEVTQLRGMHDGAGSPAIEQRLPTASVTQQPLPPGAAGTHAVAGFSRFPAPLRLHGEAGTGIG